MHASLQAPCSRRQQELRAGTPKLPRNLDLCRRSCKQLEKKSEKSRRGTAPPLSDALPSKPFYGPRCAAPAMHQCWPLLALALWMMPPVTVRMQASSQQPVMPPSSLAQCISRGVWSKDLLQALLERIYQVLRMTPAAARQLLQLAGAIASSAAAAVEVYPAICPCTKARGPEQTRHYPKVQTESLRWSMCAARPADGFVEHGNEAAQRPACRFVCSSLLALKLP